MVATDELKFGFRPFHWLIESLQRLHQSRMGMRQDVA